MADKDTACAPDCRDAGPSWDRGARERDGERAATEGTRGVDAAEEATAVDAAKNPCHHRDMPHRRQQGAGTPRSWPPAQGQLTANQETECKKRATGAQRTTLGQND